MKGLRLKLTPFVCEWLDTLNETATNIFIDVFLFDGPIPIL